MSHEKVDSLLASWLPRQCILCSAPSGALNCCAGCRGDLPWIESPCMRCGAPLPPDYYGDACARCRVTTPAIDRVVSALIYEYPVDRLVTLAKFQARPDSARVLGELLGLHLHARQAAGLLNLPDLILPVPLHRLRLARRGFNQALEIARPVARALGLPLVADACLRKRHTVEQTRLTGLDRSRNTSDAFCALTDLTGQHVAVIDDVVTTGSTVEAMALALQAAGTKRIQIWSVARTPNQPVRIRFN